MSGRCVKTEPARVRISDLVALPVLNTFEAIEPTDFDVLSFLAINKRNYERSLRKIADWLQNCKIYTKDKMTREELKQFESELQAHGYHKSTQALSSKQDWGWFKSFYDNSAEYQNSDTRIYTIEFRVWDFGKYANRDPSLKDNPYSIDTLILDGNADQRIDLEITSPKFDITTTEQIAAELHKMLAPYVEKFKEQE